MYTQKNLLFVQLMLLLRGASSAYVPREDAIATAAATATVEDTTATITIPHHITARAETPSCYLQNQQPGQGITERGCVCEQDGETRTLPLLTDKEVTNDSQSCSYTSWPGSTAENPITVGTETITYSSRCEYCLKPSGHAGQITNCNPIPDCYMLKVQLGDEKMIIGDIKHEGDEEAARKMVKDIQGGLKETCSGTTSCGSEEEFEYDTSIVVNAGYSNRLEPAKLVFNPTGGTWKNTEERDILIDGAIATWQASVAKGDVCKDMGYEKVISPGAECDSASEKRSIRQRDLFGGVYERSLHNETLEARIPPGDPGLIGPKTCFYKHPHCSVPTSIHAWYGEGGDLSSIDIDISLEMEAVDDGIKEFMCGLIIAGLAAAAQWALPIGLLTGVNFGALCDPNADVADWISL
ncbi:hypothetical protein DL769_001176 [Monosporascus sp. CRB-8-3]|nr:hypothetical protein DL769_001176 [Monosporascus sp. CRB-8-3]